MRQALRKVPQECAALWINLLREYADVIDELHCFAHHVACSVALIRVRQCLHHPKRARDERSLFLTRVGVSIDEDTIAEFVVDCLNRASQSLTAVESRARGQKAPQRRVPLSPRTTYRSASRVTSNGSQ